MKPDDPIGPYLLTGVSAVVLSHAVITDAAQLLYLPGPEFDDARYVIADDGERIPYIEVTAFTSGSPAMSISEAVEAYKSDRTWSRSTRR